MKIIARGVTPFLIRLFLPFLASILTGPLAAAPTQTLAQALEHQDLALLRLSVQQFMQKQAIGLPGDVTIEVGQVDARLNLPSCLQPEPFLAQGSRLWGKTSVGVRCVAPSQWTIYVTVNVHVLADYIIAATPLGQGQTIGNTDISKLRGDLSMLPAGVITDSAMAIGRTTLSSVQVGAPLRQDALRAHRAVQMGQTVRLLSSGPGFQVTTEGRALNNAAEGQTVQARTPTGQIISGIAKAGGILQVAY